MIGRAAGDHRDPFQLAERKGQPGQMDRASSRIDQRIERVANDFGLFEDTFGIGRKLIVVNSLIDQSRRPRSPT